MPSVSKVKVSAILAVYNGQETISACLDTLVSQSIPLEIIVVDDGSDDKTAQIVQGYRSVKFLRQDHAGPAVARNYAAQKASGNILLFVDADMTFGRDYARDLITPISEGRAVGTFTLEERVANWDNAWARCWNIEEGWQEGKRFKQGVVVGTDYRAVRRSEFLRVGGFDNIGYTDTWSLFTKLGQRPHATKAICYHHNPGSLTQVFRQARWAAKRPYKYGLIGTLAAIIRTSLPISLLLSCKYLLLTLNLHLFVFKLTYDLGRFVGILEMLLTGKLSK